MLKCVCLCVSLCLFISVCLCVCLYKAQVRNEEVTGWGAVLVCVTRGQFCQISRTSTRVYTDRHPLGGATSVIRFDDFSAMAALHPHTGAGGLNRGTIDTTSTSAWERESCLQPMLQQLSVPCYPLSSQPNAGA